MLGEFLQQSCVTFIIGGQKSLEKRNSLFLKRASDHRNIKKLESAPVAINDRFVHKSGFLKIRAMEIM